MSKKLFGTDGIRGVAGEYPLDPSTAHAVGLALGRWSVNLSERPRVLIGMDTRESGPSLAAQVGGGLRRAGVAPHLAGVITTPGVAFLTREEDFAAGVMISASHNPYRDNGIKVFDHSGYKLPDEEERLLEEEILAIRSCKEPEEAVLPVEGELNQNYLRALASTAPRFDGLRITLDCGNGAASTLAPKLFRSLGASVDAIACEPNGRNINLDCGALHLEKVRRRVIETGSDVGVAFDGDADRALFISQGGETINGDSVLLICARAMLAQRKLTGDDGRPLVVATVMSNLGLEKALEASGIELLRTPVGDKYVLEEMRRRNAALGGEQSGHVIFRDFSTTGDGMLTALRVLAVMLEAGTSLEELTADMAVYPQLLLNVRVGEKRPLAELPEVQAAIREAEEAFAGSGRIVVRFSGTEPLARVMIEGADKTQVRIHSEQIAEAIRDALSAPE